MRSEFNGLSLLLVFVALVAGLNPVPSVTFAAEGSPGKKLAFLVGVNNYQHAKLDALQFAERDVEELAIVLKEQNYTVVLLTSATGKKDQRLLPTRENIEARLMELLRKATRNDQILVGLAGHGIQPDGSADSYFCPFDGNPSVNSGEGAAPAKAKFPETLVAISGKQGLLGKLDDSGIGRKLLLIDACRNDPESGRGRGVGSTITELPERTWLLLSCSVRQRAWETGKLGGGHGVFFHFVLEGLRGKAADADGEVTWNQLSQYVTRQVEKRVPEIIGEGATQSPDMKQSGNGIPVLAVVRPRHTPEPQFPIKKADLRFDDHSKSPPPPAVAPFTATTAKQHQQAWATHLQTDVETENSIGMKMRLIPAGAFTMGSPPAEYDRFEDYRKDSTPHSVKITKPFYLGKYETTQSEWKAVMKTEPWKSKEKTREGPDFPATYVSWEDATEFCKKLSQLEGLSYRLPTEAEWEYACRSGSTTRYSFADDQNGLSDHAWFSRNASDVRGEHFAHRVGLKSANPFGLHDMHGNLYEWCQDWYDPKYYQSSPLENPSGGAGGKYRVVRGGCWLNIDWDLRSAKRGQGSPDSKSELYGFRIVRDATAVGLVTPDPTSKKTKSTPSPIDEKDITNTIGMKLRPIPAGEFMMGDGYRKHPVRITKAFELGKFEVTQGEWQSVMKTSPWLVPGRVDKNTKVGQDYPATWVTWDDAVEFCRKLSVQEGETYRLPSEAEWEYACRAGSKTTFHFGDRDEDLEKYAWYHANAYSAGENFAHRVGLKSANQLGLHDMYGNVREWCSDWWTEQYSGTLKVDPVGPKAGVYRICRGGCFMFDGPRKCCSAAQDFARQADRSMYLGFRVVRVRKGG